MSLSPPALNLSLSHDVKSSWGWLLLLDVSVWEKCSVGMEVITVDRAAPISDCNDSPLNLFL